MVNLGIYKTVSIINSQIYHSISQKDIVRNSEWIYLCKVIKNIKIMTATKATGAFLEITMKINESDRNAAAAVYSKYRQPFLETISGATSKQLLLRGDDVQDLHGFESVAEAENYLQSDLFNQDVVVELRPFFQETPEIKIYSVVG